MNPREGKGALHPREPASRNSLTCLPSVRLSAASEWLDWSGPRTMKGC